MTGFGATVYLQRPDGTIETASPTNGLFYQPSISPIGDQVVFFGGVSGFPRLWSHVPGESEGSVEPLTTEGSGARHPSFDWQGARIAFASDLASPRPGETVDEISSVTRNVRADMHLHIYTSLPDGSGVTMVTEGPYIDHRPAWSPDGEWITFASNRSGESGIWRVPASGGGDPTPVFTGTWGYRPWFTSTGESILFYGPNGDRHRIWVVNVDSGTVERLEADDRGTTHGPFLEASRPDTVLAHSTRGGSWGIWEFPLGAAARPPRCLTPDGFPIAAHASRSSTGVLAFDVKKAIAR